MPTSSVQGFRLLHTLAYTCHLLFFSDSHSNRCEEILWLWFGFLSLVILSIIFMYYWPFIYLLWKKISIQFLCLFFKSDFFCVTQLYEFFLIYIYIYTYFGYLCLIRCMTWKYFLLFCRLSLHLVDCFSCWGKLISLMEFYLSVFALLLMLLVSTTILDNIWWQLRFRNSFLGPKEKRKQNKAKWNRSIYLS